MYHPSLEPRANYEALQDIILQCEAYLEWPAEKLFEVKHDVSGWSIAYHLYHVAKAHGAIPKLLERMQAGRLGEEGLEVKPVMLQLIYEGIIPRGGKAPDIAKPPHDLTYELLIKDFGRMSKASQRIEPLLDELHAIPVSFPHIYYGPLTALEWLRFMQIHSRHHLGIIKEIEAG